MLYRPVYKNPLSQILPHTRQNQRNFAPAKSLRSRHRGSSLFPTPHFCLRHVPHTLTFSFGSANKHGPVRSVRHASRFFFFIFHPIPGTGGCSGSHLVSRSAFIRRSAIYMLLEKWFLNAKMLRATRQVVPAKQKYKEVCTSGRLEGLRIE